jgi:sucrose-phosphate synthase
LLIDPLDTAGIAGALLTSLADEADWSARAASGLRGVQEHYSWPSHAGRYVDLIKPIADRTELLVRKPKNRRPMLYHDRAIFTDLDQNLLGDPESLRDFIQIMQDNRKCVSFGIATGRRLDSALKVMKKYGIPEPDVLITSGGTELHYAPKLTLDQPWSKHIDHHWQPERVREVLADLPGLELQKRSEQSRFKISYFIDPAKAPPLDEINSRLHQQDQSVNVVLSFGQFLDILPIRASKGLALRYFAARWEVPLDRILVAGGSGADEDMMRGNTLAVVVSNRHNEELSQLVDIDRIYFAERSHARGILEAIDHYDFFRACTVPEEEHVA